jgi:hypothetical protein
LVGQPSTPCPSTSLDVELLSNNITLPLSASSRCRPPSSKSRSLATAALTLLGHSSHSEPGFLPHLSLATLVFLFVGVVAALLAQFYAILGFLISQPNQSDFASSTGTGGSNEEDVHGAHRPWYQGRALSVYATLARAFAIAAGTLASLTWRLSAWKVDAAKGAGNVDGEEGAGFAEARD